MPPPPRPGATTWRTATPARGPTRPRRWRRTEIVASIQGTSNERLRQQLVTEGIMAAQDGMLVFTLDHRFSSPSMAAMAVMGRSANGWIEWKAANGKTLDELKRQVVGVSA